MERKVYYFKEFLTVLCIMLSCVRLSAQTPTLAWAKQLGGADGTHSYLPPECGNAITVDANGNVYTIGHFSGTTDFDPGTDTFNLTAKGDIDIYISKLDATGKFVWVKQIGGTGEDEGKGIAVDAAGNCYITGYFDGTTDFDPGTSTLLLTGISYDVFMAKLNASGSLIWAKRIGGSGMDFSSTIALDDTGNLYIAGGFGDTVDFDPDTNTFNLACSGGAWDIDMFITKLDTAGKFVWAKGMGAADGYDMINAITVDASGLLYTTGYFTGTVDFDPGVGTELLTTVLWDDIFVSKWDASGNLIWAKQFGGDGSQEMGNAITVDDSGNVYTTGKFNSTVDFDPGTVVYNLSVPSNNGYHIFVSKLNASGQFVWARQIGTNDASNMGMNEGYSIKTDALSNVYLSGNFGGIVDFDPAPGPADTFNLYSPIDFDAFICKLDASGIFVWAMQLGKDDFTAEVIKSMDVDLAGNIYTTGYFYGMSDFDPGSGTHYLFAYGAADAFVEKLATCNAFDTLTQMACHHFDLNGHRYTQSGTYIQNFVGAGGCDSMLLLKLTINTQLPDIGITQNANQLQADAVNASYQWLNCDNNYSPIPGATTQSYQATQNGRYAVIVTQNTCSDTSECYAVIELGITNGALNGNHIRVYPNPGRNRITVQADRYLHRASLKLTNITGQTLWEQDGLSGNSFSIAIAAYPPGMYMVSVAEDGKVFRVKVIKD